MFGAKIGKNWRPAILSGTALALAAALPAAAQEAPGAADSFRLQPATPTAAPTPTPTPAPPPVVAPPPPVIAPTASPAPTPRPAATPAARPTALPSPRPAAASTASPAATPTPPTVPVPAGTAAPEPLPTLASEPAPPLAEPAGGEPVWPWLAGGAAIVVLGGAALLLRRRKVQPEPEYFEEEAPLASTPAPAPTPEPSPPAVLPPRAVPASPPPGPEPTPLPEPALSLDDIPPPPPVRGKAGETLAVQLVARRLSATLMNTALTYEFTVTNTGSEPIGPIAVSGDMIGAHSSIPPKVLLETAGDGEPQHRVPLLGPGESAAMSGELRLPLASITPIRHGAATLFVPLARFRLLVFREGRPPVSANHAFVIGEEPATPGAALKPFRLDLGPRLYSGITQRELALPA